MPVLQNYLVSCGKPILKYGEFFGRVKREPGFAKMRITTMKNGEGLNRMLFFKALCQPRRLKKILPGGALWPK